MTTSFPLDGQSLSSHQKQQNKSTQPKASKAVQKQLSPQEAEKLAFQELAAICQEHAKQHAKENGELYPLHLLPSNWAGLARLELSLQNSLDHHASMTNFARGTVYQLVNKFLIEPADLQEIKKLTQVIPVMRLLLDKFESQSIVIQPRINLPKYGSLDLLLRFTQAPNKATFGIALRSQGDSNIVYNENKEALYIRQHKGKGGLSQWTPNHIDQLGDQEFWLRKNFRKVFGESARDKNRSMVKLLVLTGNTKLGKHSEHLYETVGDQKILLLKKRCSVYVMEEEQLISFLETRMFLKNP